MITLPSNEDASTQLASFQLAGSLTPPERRAFSVATLDAPWGEQCQPPETAYLAVLPAARRSILLRLIGGLLRDRPEPLSDPSIVAPDEQVDETFEALSRRNLDLSSVLNDCGVSGTISELAVLPFPAAETLLIVPVTRTYGFARFWLTTPVVAARSATTTIIRQPSQIVHLLQQEGVFPDSSHAERFAREIDESVANLALAYLAKETFKNQFVDVQGSVFDGLRQREVPAADPLAFFERLVTDGHPFHPGAKIRRGMTPSDSLTYAPEFTDRIALRFMAMRREETLDSTISEETLTGRLLELFPGLQTAVTENLPPKTSLSSLMR